jgi:hypothetical protein
MTRSLAAAIVLAVSTATHAGPTVPVTTCGQLAARGQHGLRPQRGARGDLLARHLRPLGPAVGPLQRRLSLLFPDARVTCCEIEPAVFAASSHFGVVNHKREASPQFSLVLDDGRSYCRGRERGTSVTVGGSARYQFTE